MERHLALAELALQWNIVSQKELPACLKEKGRGGDAKSLGQIMVAKGILRTSNASRARRRWPLANPRVGRAPKASRASTLLRSSTASSGRKKGRWRGRGRSSTASEAICGVLGEGKRVELRRLGVFEPVGGAPRKVGNPRTGQIHAGSFRSAVRFKVSKDLLKRMKEEGGGMTLPAPRLRGTPAA